MTNSTERSVYLQISLLNCTLSTINASSTPTLDIILYIATITAFTMLARGYTIRIPGMPFIGRENLPIPILPRKVIIGPIPITDLSIGASLSSAVLERSSAAIQWGHVVELLMTHEAFVCMIPCSGMGGGGGGGGGGAGKKCGKRLVRRYVYLAQN